MISLLIGWEAIARLLNPVPIAFSEAIPIACLGLAVNVASAWLLSGGHHHGDQSRHHDHDDSHTLVLAGAPLTINIHENGVRPHFYIQTTIPAAELTAETSGPMAVGNGSR